MSSPRSSGPPSRNDLAALAIPPRPRLDPLVAPRRAWAGDRPLTFVGVAMLLTFAATLVGLVVDDRVITGAPAWL